MAIKSIQSPAKIAFFSYFVFMIFRKYKTLATVITDFMFFFFLRFFVQNLVGKCPKIIMRNFKRYKGKANIFLLDFFKQRNSRNLNAHIYLNEHNSPSLPYPHTKFHSNRSIIKQYRVSRIVMLFFLGLIEGP